MPIFKKKFVVNIAVMCVLAGGLLFFQGSGGEVEADTKGVYKNIEILTEVLRQIEKNYVEPQESQDLIYGAIRGDGKKSGSSLFIHVQGRAFRVDG